MHKVKGMRRMPVRLDMTPMVDIAFLLLIFYMATTQFKPPEAQAVELPASHSQIELPERDVVNVTITREDSVLVDWIEPGGDSAGSADGADRGSGGDPARSGGTDSVVRAGSAGGR